MRITFKMESDLKHIKQLPTAFMLGDFELCFVKLLQYHY